MTTIEKARVAFHEKAEVTRVGSIRHLDEAVAAYISAFLPEDAGKLVGELLTLKSGFAADGDNFGMEVSEALHNAASLIQSQAARIAELEAALEPFATAANDAERLSGHDGPLGQYVELEHLRAARLLLNGERTG